MNQTQEITCGLAIGQAWQDRRAEVCRVVTIDPTMHLIEVEDRAGHVETDTIEHFLSTHFARAS
jgi:hypothetical protein